MAHDAVGGANAKVRSDFPNGRTVATITDLVLQEFVDLFLAAGQGGFNFCDCHSLSPGGQS